MKNNVWIILAFITSVFVTVEILASRVAMYGKNGTSLGIPAQSIDIVTFAFIARFLSSVITLLFGICMYAILRTIKKEKVQEYYKNQMERQKRFLKVGIKSGKLWLFLWLTGAAMACVILTYASAQQFAPHTSLPPAVQSSCLSIFVLIAGYFILKEKNIESTQIVGIFVTALGIFLVIFKKESLKKYVYQKVSCEY